MVENRAADEELEACRLRLAAKATDLRAVVVHSPADSVPVCVVRICAAENLGVGNFGQ